MARQKYTDVEKGTFHFFSATISTLQDKLKFDITRTSCVAIFPYAATEMATIFTSMFSSQDVLKPKNVMSGALWSDEGVYAIANEIQLLKPKQFGNIFLGVGPFHMEKIVIACLGKHLGCIGIDLALVETESFGKLVVENSVMAGGHYCKGKEAMSLLSEVMTVLMLEKLKCDMGSTYSKIDNQIQIMETKMKQASDVDHTEFRLIWDDSKLLHADLKQSFTEWKAKSCN